MHLLFLLQYFIIYCTSEEDNEHCDQTFAIFKNTQASSDSERECANGFNIFPYIQDEGANKFHDGECAYQCKLQLPDTCFAIHAPQTMQHDEGLLAINILEKKMSQKWQHAINELYSYDYDAFFDYNMGFWVQSLDDYIHHWNTYEYTSQSHDLEYFGIEWNIDIDDTNTRFYSILIHSPSSSINYEFMSQYKPSDDLYPTIKWIASDVARCTFKAMNNPYPWDREDHAVIVPVRISHAVSNIQTMYDFYVNVMGGTLLQDSHHLLTDMDSMTVETFSVLLINSVIELQFIKRPQGHTYGDFSVNMYESLLIETHHSIITSPYCGIDRWFDQHFGYLSLGIDRFMDTMLRGMDTRNMIYRVYKLPYEHSSVLMKRKLDEYGYDTQYGAIVIDPSGQCIEVNGYTADPTLQQFAPVANPQWCSTPCRGDRMQGVVDPERVYTDNEVDIDDIDIMKLDGMEIMHKEQQHHGLGLLHLVVIIFGSIFVVSCALSIVYCCWDRINCCWKKKHRKKGKMLYENANETTPFL